MARALLSIDFKVCRLITETVSDHIRKKVTNRHVFLPFSRASEARTRKFFHNFITAELLKALQLIH